ncbi:MAG: hypothetical protein ACE5HI_06555 [bacterium]
MPELIIGSPPRGEDYFGQSELIENLWTKLKKDNVLLVAPRRFGKTGAMYRLLDEPHRQFRVFYIDVEPINTAANFMIELIAVLLRDSHLKKVMNDFWEGTKGFGHFIRNLPESIDVGGVKVKLRENTDVPQEWLSYGERIMSLIAMDGTPLLLLIDEFAVMINRIARKNKAEMEQLLRWFRSARIAPKTQTRFVIGGSINLISTLDSLGLVDTVNDLALVRLKPFKPDIAKAYVHAIFKSKKLQISTYLIDIILELVGTPIPYLLAVLLSSIIDRQRATKNQISKEMINKAFQEDLLGGAASTFFGQYRSRINDYYSGLEARAAKAILGTISRSDTAVRRDVIYQIYLKTLNLQHNTNVQENFLQLMYKLENDFYVTAENDTYGFFSRVIQLWWKNHYGFQGE